MKTNVVMRVTPEQSCKVQEIAIAQGHQWMEGGANISHTCSQFLYLRKDKIMLRSNYKDHSYEEVDADLFIRTNGTCEEWKPEPGEMIMVWQDFEHEMSARKRQFITMTKDGKRFICHTLDGNDAMTWPNAKPAQNRWTDLVSENNPAICWVWDNHETKGNRVAVIVGRGAYYKSSFGADWNNAQFIMWAKDAK